MCPAAPMLRNRLPHAVARCFANAMLAYGSLVLATTILENGSSLLARGEKPEASTGKFSPSGSGTATSNAPAIVIDVMAAQFATSRQPRLCAAMTTSDPALETAASSAPHHSSHTG